MGVECLLDDPGACIQDPGAALVCTASDDEFTLLVPTQREDGASMNLDDALQLT